MINNVETIIITFIQLILPLIGLRIVLDYTRMLLFKE